MPLGGQEEMLPLVSRRMGGLFSVPATQLSLPRCSLISDEL